LVTTGIFRPQTRGNDEDAPKTVVQRPPGRRLNSTLAHARHGRTSPGAAQRQTQLADRSGYFADSAPMAAQTPSAERDLALTASNSRHRYQSAYAPNGTVTRTLNKPRVIGPGEQTPAKTWPSPCRHPPRSGIS